MKLQTDEFEFNELIRTSTLLHFVTNLAPQNRVSANRSIIPITSPEATVTYHLFCKDSKKSLLPPCTTSLL